MTLLHGTPHGRRPVVVSVASRCIAMLSLLIAACAAPPPPPDVPTGAPADYSERRYRDLAADELVFEIDAERTLIRIYVYRGGALARLGHDHVVASRDVAGFVLLGPDEGGERRVEADLYAPLAAMSVDEAALRQEAKFTTEPSESDREGTRGNMLKSVGAAEHPFVALEVQSSAAVEIPGGGRFDIDVTVTLNGVTSLISVPVDVRVDAASLGAAGAFTIRQTAFDIEPFSVLGGALTVKDEIDIRFELHADRLSLGHAISAN